MSLMRKRTISVMLLLGFLSIAPSSASEIRTDPIGVWTFDNPESLLGAQQGNDLELVGTHEAISGPAVGDGAARIGLDSYYRCHHDIAANGAGNPAWVNRFTLVMDIRIPQADLWYCLYQTNYSNNNDGDWFINQDGHVGVGDTGYSYDTITPGEWYRLAISVSLGEHYDYYLDGQLLHNGGPQSIDGRFALYPADGANQVLFFADENGEDNAIDVAGIWLYETDLAAQELADLGGYGHIVSGPPSNNMLPYLQSPTATSIHIGWHSAESTGSVVEYGLDENLGSQTTGTSAALDPTTIWHHVLLNNLSPDTSYYYRCLSGDEESEMHRFTTQPANDSSDMHVRFMVYGDNRTDSAQHTAVVQAFRDKAVELYGPDLDKEMNLVLNVGDIVTTGSVLSQYKAEYFSPVASTSGDVPFMISIGNHEAEAAYFYDYMEYEELAGPESERYYAFNTGPVLFIALNSNTRGDTQLDWLASILDAAETDSDIDWVFTYAHHPGRSEIWPDGNTAWIQDGVIPLLAQHNKAEGLFYGHSHNYERGAPDEGSFRLLLSGGGGSVLDRWGMYANQEDYPEIQCAYDYYCYVIFDVDCLNRSYTASSYSLGHSDRPMGNELFDSFSRDLDADPPQEPQAVSPIGLVAEVIALIASEYAGDKPMMSSQFQLDIEGGDWSAGLIDAVHHWENVYGDSGAPDWLPVDLNAGLDLTQFELADGLLSLNQEYQWRLRYRDQNLKWSEWSETVVFQAIATAVPGTVPKIQRRLSLSVPNPFSPATEIRFGVAFGESVTLDIFDMKGRHVRNLTSGAIGTGEHALPWDGCDFDGRAMPTGCYLFRLSSDHESISRKTILLR
jgi:Purple acid Phosphatase, N-terminal domain/Calcineurin-like phosphoesterase/FlgD Ig-like domain